MAETRRTNGIISNFLQTGIPWCRSLNRPFCVTSEQLSSGTHSTEFDVKRVFIPIVALDVDGATAKAAPSGFEDHCESIGGTRSQRNLQR